MPRKEKNDDNEEDDDDDSSETPFDFSNVFNSNLFKSKEFQGMFKDIYKKISEQLPKNFQNQNFNPEDIQKWLMKNKGKIFPGSPFVAGFNINFRPDGTPIVDSFGNIRPQGTKTAKNVDVDVREPLIDISEEATQIIIIAEMPGVTKADIVLKSTTHSITIYTKEEGANRRYYKEIELPSSINSDYAKARYQNGILEVILKKTDEKSTNIKID